MSVDTQVPSIPGLTKDSLLLIWNMLLGGIVTIILGLTKVHNMNGYNHWSFNALLSNIKMD
jgi:hypothetical protein